MQQKAAQAVLGGGVEGHVLEPLFCLSGGFGLYIRGQTVVGLPLLVDEKADGAHIRAGIQQGAPGGLTVAPGAPCLLIIAFQILWHIIMDDEPHVWLVDAHAKGIGGNHHLYPVVEEIVLILPPGVCVQLGVVSCRPDAAALQQLHRLVHLPGGAAIHDARMIALLEHQFQQLLGLLAGQCPPGLEVQVGAVEAGGHLVGRLQRQMGADILPHMGGGGGSERADDRAAGQAVHKFLDAQIAGAEVLSPLADAVRLVHRDHADLPLLREPLEARHLQPLRCHIDDLVPALPGAVQHQRLLVVGQAVVQKSRRHARLHQRSHLILHQADQRGHHDGNARQQQCRYLIADGFARAGGHDRQHILPGQQAADDFLLPGAEAVVAENFFQDTVRVFHGLLRYISRCADAPIAQNLISIPQIRYFWQKKASLCAKMCNIHSFCPGRIAFQARKCYNENTYLHATPADCPAWTMQRKKEHL